MTTDGSADVPLEVPRPVRPARLWRRRTVAAAIVGYFLALIVLWVWLRFRGDLGAWATMFLFAPRWLCLVPLVVLVPLAAIWQRRLWWVLTLCFLIGLVPISGFRLNVPHPKATYALRVVTCNVAQQSYRVGALAEMVRTLDPDVVALQEIKRYPPDIVWPRDWHVLIVDELLVASRFPVEKADLVMRPAIPNKPAAVRFIIKRPQGDVQLFNLHLMTPRPGLEAVLDRHQGFDLSGLPKLESVLELRDLESSVISRWVIQHDGPKIVVGDFNTPADSTVFRRDWAPLSNAFSEAGFGFGFTKLTGSHGWQYGARIDHILYSPPWRCVRAWIGPELGSDHRPLVADFQE